MDVARLIRDVRTVFRAREIDDSVVRAAVELARSLGSEELEELARHIAAAYGAASACGAVKECQEFARIERARADSVLYRLEAEVYDEKLAIVYTRSKRPSAEYVRSLRLFAEEGFRIAAYDEERVVAECCGVTAEIITDIIEHPDCLESLNPPKWCWGYKVISKELCNGICKKEFRSITEAMKWIREKIAELQKQKMRMKG